MIILNKMTFVSYFIVRVIAWDEDQYNLLFEEPLTGNIISAYSKTKPSYAEEDYIGMKFTAECHDYFQSYRATTKIPGETYVMFINIPGKLCTATTMEQLK